MSYQRWIWMDMSTSGYWLTRDGNGMELSPQVDNDPQGMEKEFPITERK